MKDWALARTMLERGETAAVVARALGCHPNSVRAWAQRRDVEVTVKMRPKLPGREAEFRELAAQGLSASELARHFGMSNAICTIRFARKLGVKLTKEVQRAKQAHASIESLREELLRRFEYRSDGTLVHRRSSQVGIVIRTATVHGYVPVIVGGRSMMAHRAIWLMHFGELPEAIDHINGVRADNRIENLRACTHAENACNITVVYGATPFKGVTKLRYGKFQAQITKDRKVRYLGVFDTAEEAAAVYDEAALKLHGEFACINANTRGSHAYAL